MQIVIIFDLFTNRGNGHDKPSAQHASIQVRCFKLIQAVIAAELHAVFEIEPSVFLHDLVKIFRLDGKILDGKVLEEL